MKKRILSIVFSLCMVLAFMPQTVFAEGGIPYLDALGASQTCASATVVTSEDNTWGDDENSGWYIAQGDVTIGNNVIVSGDVHLILADECNLTVNSSITDGSLTIYGQAGGTGTLHVNGDIKGGNGITGGNGDGPGGAGGTGGNGGGISIIGGTVKATGSIIGGNGGSGGNGVGQANGIGGNGGNGGGVSITGGTVEAGSITGGNGGIGGNGDYLGSGGNGGSGGGVSITGGTVMATGSITGSNGGNGGNGGKLNDGSGGSGGNGGNGGGVSITGGTVMAENITRGNGGNGGNDGRSWPYGPGGVGRNGDNGNFSTGTNGNAVIFANSIGDKSNQSGWSGVIFEYNNGAIYGNVVTPSEDFTIPIEKTLTIEENQTLAILEGKTLTNVGIIDNSGKIYVDGTLSGTVGGNGPVYYHLTVNGGTATDTLNLEQHDGKTYGKAGSEIILTPDTPPTGYSFDKWVVLPSSVTVDANNSFTMPSTPLEITAQWKDIENPVITGLENNKTYCDAVEFEVSDNDGIASVKAGNEVLTAGSNGKYKLAAGVGAVTVVATDNSGNETAVTVTVNNGHTGGEATCKDKAICEYCGSEYGEIDSSNHNLDNIPATDATVTETGNKEYWQCKDCKKYFSDEDGNTQITDIESWKAGDGKIDKLNPEIIEGKGQSVTVGEKKELTFRSNAAFRDFIRVELDGKELDEKNYTVKEGSTIVTLKADYVATLSAGKHTIGIVSTSGTAETTFTVNAKTAVVKASNSPQTGDATNLALWIALMLISGILLSVLGISGKKKKHNR